MQIIIFKNKLFLLVCHALCLAYPLRAKFVTLKDLATRESQQQKEIIQKNGLIAKSNQISNEVNTLSTQIFNLQESNKKHNEDLLLIKQSSENQEQKIKELEEQCSHISQSIVKSQNHLIALVHILKSKNEKNKKRVEVKKEKTNHNFLEANVNNSWGLSSYIQKTNLYVAGLCIFFIGVLVATFYRGSYSSQKKK